MIYLRLSAVLLALATTHCRAQSIKATLGVGSFQLRASDPTVGDSSGSGLGGFVGLGLGLSEYLDAELRMSTSAVSTDRIPLASTIDIGDYSYPAGSLTDTQHEPSYLVSLLLRPHIDITEHWKAYGLAGMTFGQLAYRANVGPSQVNSYEIGKGSDLTFGGGLQRQIGSSLRAGIEWTEYMHDKDVAGRNTSIRGLTLSLTNEF